MKTNNNNLSGSSNDLKCIWMTSQQVAYKLCDKEFDCENCEFDKIFRNRSIRTEQQNSFENINNDLLESSQKFVWKCLLPRNKSYSTLFN